MSLSFYLLLCASVGEVIFFIFILADIEDIIRSIVKHSPRKITLEKFKHKFTGIFYFSFMMAPAIILTRFSISKGSGISSISFDLIYAIIALFFCAYSSYLAIKQSN